MREIGRIGKKRTGKATTSARPNDGLGVGVDEYINTGEKTQWRSSLEMTSKIDAHLSRLRRDDEDKCHVQVL